MKQPRDSQEQAVASEEAPPAGGDTRGQGKSRSPLGMYLRYGLANVLLPLSALLTGPLLARALGPEGRGIMAALLAPVSLANLMFTLGAPESMTYHVAKRLVTRSATKRFVIWAGLSCGALAVAVCALATPYVLRKYPDLHGAFYLMLLTLPLTLGFAALRGIAQGLGKFDAISAERTLSIALRVAAIVFVVVTGLITPTVAAWITILSGAAGSLLLVRFFHRWRFEAPSAAPRRDLRRYALSSALGTFGAFLVLRLDQTLMAPLAGAAELGYYAVAVSLAEVPIIVVTAVRDVVFTVAADRDDPTITARVSRLTTLLSIPVCGIGCLIAPLAIPFLFGNSFAPSVAMTQVLLAATVMSTTTAIAGAGLMSLGKAGWRSALQVAGAAVTAALVFLLVPSHGGMGAAIASLVTYGLLSLGSVVLFSRASGLKMRECLVPTRQDLRELSGSARRIAARLRSARR